MKHKTKGIAWLLFLCILLFALPAAHAEPAEAGWPKLPITYADQEEFAVNSDGTINADAFVRYPVFSAEEEAFAPAIEKVNRAIEEKAHISAYLQLLATVSGGGAGLKMDYELNLLSSAELTPDFHVSCYGRYVSLLFSAEGKMLSGRPSQVSYPMTFDLLTGEEITFDQLFSDPEGAKAFIESALEEDVEPSLSTYLENSQLFPVPYDRFFLDAWGHIVLLYENDQLSFLSGASGAVSFRYSELAPWLDTGENSVIAQLPYFAHNAGCTEEENRGAVWNTLKNGFLVLSNRGEAQLGTALKPILDAFHPAADSGYYPGGACWEVENPHFRGTYLLTDESGETLFGLLSSRVELPGIQTGSTSLQEAVRFLGRAPDAQLPLDAAAAEIYLVCPGTAAVYSFESAFAAPMTLTLYADESGVVQYMKLAIQ